jgi:hypothetical protein
MYDISNTTLETWFERDRALVSITDSTTDRPILSVWDDDVHALVEDGLLDPRDWRGSATEYANNLQLQPA